MPTLGWRWLLAFSALPSSLLLLFYGLTPESPRYLCNKGRANDALNILEKAARMNRTNLPSGVLISSHQIELLEKRDTSEDIHLLSPEKMEQASPSCTDSSNKCSSLSMLLSPELARSTLLLWVVFFGNAFSYYGLVLLTTELNNGHNKCTVTEVQSKASQDVNYADVFITSFAGMAFHFLIFFSLLAMKLFRLISDLIFFHPWEQTGFTFDFYLLPEFPGLILSACVVDKFGRKLSMSAMFFLCCIFLFPLLFHQAPGLTTGLLFGARICITATFTIVYIYAPEVSRK